MEILRWDQNQVNCNSVVLSNFAFIKGSKMVEIGQTQTKIVQNKLKIEECSLIRTLMMSERITDLPDNSKRKTETERGIENKQLLVYTKEEIEYTKKLAKEI